jgi:hypothetical protein
MPDSVAPGNGGGGGRPPYVPGELSPNGKFWWDGTEWRRFEKRAGDHGVYQAIVAALVGIIAAVIVGAVIANLMSKTLQTELIAIAASAVSGLIGLLAPSPLSDAGSGCPESPVAGASSGAHAAAG